MKKAILFSGFIYFFGNTGFSQTVNGVQLNNFKVEYMQITERVIKANESKIHLLVNYGQHIDPIGNMEKLLLDSTGKRMEFNSIIDGLNFMSDHGYEVIQTYKTDSISYLMRKRKKD